MHSTTHHPTKTARDSGASGFVLWIAVYAAFMLGLIVLNGGTDLFSYHQMDWPALAAAR